MSSFENNKIFAAVLCVGITVMLTGFVANKLMHPKELENDAVSIDGAAVDHGGAQEEKTKIPEPILALLASADIDKGAKISKACAACHSFDKGGPTKQGPNLWNIVNSLKCENADFKYSDALHAKGGSWNYQSLNAFLKRPKDYVPGTKMNFAGLKKPEDRADLIAWMRTLSDSPAPLPTEAEITAEAPAPADENTPEQEQGETATEH